MVRLRADVLALDVHFWTGSMLGILMSGFFRIGVLPGPSELYRPCADPKPLNPKRSPYGRDPNSPMWVIFTDFRT